MIIKYLSFIFKFLNIILLFICAIEDIKERKIRIGVILLFVLTSIISAFILVLSNDRIFDLMSILKILSGSIFGIIFYIISLLSNEKIGRGDALIIIGAGMGAGILDIIIILFISFIISSLYGVFICIKNKRRICEIPFVPCLFLPYSILIIGF